MYITATFLVIDSLIQAAAYSGRFRQHQIIPSKRNRKLTACESECLLSHVIHLCITLMMSRSNKSATIDIKKSLTLMAAVSKRPLF